MTPLQRHHGSFGRDGQVGISCDGWGSMGLRWQLLGDKRLAVVVWWRQLHGSLVIRQRHPRREVHLYTVMDVLLFDQPTWSCCVLKAQTDNPR